MMRHTHTHTQWKDVRDLLDEKGGYKTMFNMTPFLLKDNH